MQEKRKLKKAKKVIGVTLSILLIMVNIEIIGANGSNIIRDAEAGKKDTLAIKSYMEEMIKDADWLKKHSVTEIFKKQGLTGDALIQKVAEMSEYFMRVYINPEITVTTKRQKSRWALIISLIKAMPFVSRILPESPNTWIINCILADQSITMRVANAKQLEKNLLQVLKNSGGMDTIEQLVKGGIPIEEIEEARRVEVVRTNEELAYEFKDEGFVGIQEAGSRGRSLYMKNPIHGLENVNASRGFVKVRNQNGTYSLYDGNQGESPIPRFKNVKFVTIQKAGGMVFVIVQNQDGTWILYDVNDLANPMHTFENVDSISIQEAGGMVFVKVRNQNGTWSLYDVNKLESPIPRFENVDSISIQEAGGMVFVIVQNQDGTWILYDVNDLANPMHTFENVDSISIQEAGGMVFVIVQKLDLTYSLYEVKNLEKLIPRFENADSISIQEAGGMGFVKVRNQNGTWILYDINDLATPMHRFENADSISIQEAGGKIDFLYQQINPRRQTLYSRKYFEFKESKKSIFPSPILNTKKASEIYKRIKSKLLKRIFLSNIMHLQELPKGHDLLESDFGQYLLTHMIAEEIKSFINASGQDAMEFLTAAFAGNINDGRQAQELLKLLKDKKPRSEIGKYVTSIRNNAKDIVKLDTVAADSNDARRLKVGFFFDISSNIGEIFMSFLSPVEHSVVLNNLENVRNLWGNACRLMKLSEIMGLKDWGNWKKLRKILEKLINTAKILVKPWAARGIADKTLNMMIRKGLVAKNQGGFNPHNIRGVMCAN